MNTAQSIGVAALIAIASMLGLMWLSVRHDPAIRQVVFSIDGSSSAAVMVTIEADGETTTTQHAIPCEVPATARNRIVFSIHRTDDGTGTIEVDLKVDGQSRSKTTSNRGALGRLEFSGTKVILSSMTGL